MYHSNTGIAYNPFGTKMASSSNVPDSTESKESKSIVAPASFRPFEQSSSSSISSTSAKFTLRPSALSLHASRISNPEPSQDSNNEVSASSSNNATNSHEASGSTSNSSDNCTSSTTTNKTSTEAGNSGSVSSSTDECSFSSLASKSTLDSGTNSNRGGCTGFVFGQNIHERVANADDEASSSIASNGTTELSFAHTAQAAASTTASAVAPDVNNEASSSQGLSESAKKYESRQVKRTYEEVAVVTGEEDESNVLQINCKLYLFEKDGSNWHERGRGLLRLNDKDVSNSQDCIQSRLVMRTHGSLRVVLNSKIWPEMSVEKPSPKSLRISAMDADGVKIYLIQANPKDINQLNDAITWRIITLQRQTEDKKVDQQSKPESVDSTTDESSGHSPAKKAKTDESCEADTSSNNEASQ